MTAADKLTAVESALRAARMALQALTENDRVVLGDDAVFALYGDAKGIRERLDAVWVDVIRLRTRVRMHECEATGTMWRGRS